MSNVAINLTIKDNPGLIGNCSEPSLEISLKCPIVDRLNQTRIIVSPLNKNTLKKLEMRTKAIARKETRKPESEDKQYFKNIGIELFNTIFDGLWEDYSQGIKEYLSCTDQSENSIQICIHTEGMIASKIPWELLCVPTRKSHYFLGCDEDSTIVRVPQDRLRGERQTINHSVRVLLAEANPINCGGHHAIDEVNTIKACLNSLERSGKAEITVMENASWKKFQKGAGQVQPEILHLIAHGIDDRVLFETAEKQDIPAAVDALYRYLKSVKSLRMVVLSMCGSERIMRLQESSAIGSLLSKHNVWAILTMNTNFTADASLDFFQALYESLALGKSLSRSVAAARNSVCAMTSHKSLEWSTPILHQACDIVPFPPIRSIREFSEKRALSHKTEGSLTSKTAQLKLLSTYILQVFKGLQNPHSLTSSALSMLIPSPDPEHITLISNIENDLSQIRECPAQLLSKVERTAQLTNKSRRDFDAFVESIEHLTNINKAKQLSQLAYKSINSLKESIEDLLM